MMELKTDKEKLQRIEEWKNYIGDGKKVIGLRNNNLFIKIQTKNFLVAYSIIISSMAGFILLGFMIFIPTGNYLEFLMLLLGVIPFALLGWFIHKRSNKVFQTFSDNTFKINNKTYFGQYDYLKIYIEKIVEDNFMLYTNTALAVTGNAQDQIEPQKYYHVILETANESTKIGFSSGNANKIFQLLSSFVYANLD